MSELSDLQKEINNLKLKSKGIELEYQYVNELKDKKILKLQNDLKEEEEKKEYYIKEFEECVKKMEHYRDELNKIKSSRWWKIKEKIKNKIKG